MRRGVCESSQSSRACDTYRDKIANRCAENLLLNRRVLPELSPLPAVDMLQCAGAPFVHPPEGLADDCEATAEMAQVGIGS